ncbi:hypothetical protein [Streptomyces jumonjinensis]|uniref:Uncharacterized protein n=1 Tax=Streptomyces jumonjinensis TaxID=1945 RepID=A0A646KNI1_STRJU|nr:hypothetical protein [Streptomyces jumonjinensis]MQT03874.1 hypothetical protein [Streptomyces jumonjinensis]
MTMRLPARLRLLAHRRGWIASPSLAYLGVPFGPQKRDLALEVAAALGARCAAGTCAICGPDPEPHETMTP